ncbi:efflux RND transporter periplasmic adaptor subunit [Alteromonas sp. a30]|uniref:efflux RND transporter periplasmic adaptor subunit n=1 Tax=Alteromonas sp. a30 TaxID=2730917 RepID=UPI00228030DA|nr:efflux RND transporter periplasmic adaptor subunit [Alteromonas sp. a30]MCY7296742.1 efflux RND transporter periplasmic adaptor subunit [Alteromonas sp. a30]
MSTLKTTSIGIVIGIVLTSLYSNLFHSGEDSTDSDEKKPLYWVAPMDANFRRDGPGKSPMGMDLVPVYEESGANDEPGTVRISPDIIQSLGVRVAYARTQSLPQQVQTVGYVKYNEDNLTHIHPRVEGWIDKLYVKTEGVRVKQGDPLYELYSPELVNAQEELLLALHQNSRTLISAAQGRLKALKMPQDNINKLKETRQVQRSVIFYAPTSGIVDMLNIREGAFVKPGTAMMTLGDLNDIWVEAEVFEQQAGMIHLGQSIELTADFNPSRIWVGKVDFIYPALNPKNRALRLRATFPNHDHQLQPNMFTQVNIIDNDTTPRLLVPSSAVIRTPHMNRVVLAKGNGVFKSIAVNVGRRTSEFTEIHEGLMPGDAVVTSAQFLLDSESSISSDFMRISHSSGGPDLSEPLQSAEVEGEIVSLDIEQRVANIHRGAIEKWGRPPATVEFVFDKGLDPSQLNESDKLRFVFEIRNGDFVIVNFARFTGSKDNGAST